MEYLFLLTGLLLGTILGWILSRSLKKETPSVPLAKFEELQRQHLEIEKQLSQTSALRDTELARREKLDADIEQERHARSELQSRYDTLVSNYSNLKERLHEQKTEIEKLQEQFAAKFQVLANQILEEKSQKFTQQNKEQLHQLLGPLSERIKDFEKKVEEGNKETLAWNSQLKQQLNTMQDLNAKITKEAENLTKALKGDVKKQGNWGEVILERILEQSGLRKDSEYKMEDSTTIDGKRLRPDVVIYLPDQKFLIIDSKVSLVAYERWNSAESDVEQQAAAREFVTSLKAHIKNLASKNYQDIHGSGSPNFVLLFIPIESAFALAVRLDSEIYQQAFDNNIVIVSPSTLLATLSTIANIWKHEYQNRNALEIADRGGKLYEKFKGFVDAMLDIGKSIEKSQKSYETAMTRLTDGPGNLVRQAEMLKELGANTNAKMPSEVTKNLE